MTETRDRLLHAVLRFTDLLVMAVAFFGALLLSGELSHPGGLAEFLAVRIKLGNFVVFVVFMLLWYLLFRSFGIYSNGRHRLLTTEWWSLSKATAAGTLLLSGLGLLLDLEAIDGLFLASFFLVFLAGAILSRGLLRAVLGEVRRQGRYLRNLVIVGCGRRGAELGAQVRRSPELGYLLLGFIDDLPAPGSPLHEGPEKLLGPLARAREILASVDVDEVAIYLPIKSHYETVREIVMICEELGLTVRIPADFFGSRLAHRYSDDLEGGPLLVLEPRSSPDGGLAVKRVIDVVVSAAALLVLSPLLALLAIAIRVGSGRPVFYVQERVGRGMKRFGMVKFRTMERDAELHQQELEALNEASGAAFKIDHDPRITRIGAVLRRYSLDELPQLWNVLQGDMSLVGPRPLPVRDVERFDREWQKRRFSVRPGLTCLWQMNGRHKVAFDEWMELDLEYIDSWSLSLDFDILLRTVPAVLRGTGAS